MGAIVFQLSPLTFPNSKENVKIMNLCIIFQTFALTRQRKIALESALTKQFENDINITCELVKWCNQFTEEFPTFQLFQEVFDIVSQNILSKCKE